MRKSFVSSIEQVMEANDRVVVLIGDIGGYLMRNIKNKYPSRLMNLGIAEANMIGVASGMALDGWIPFVYTITPFVTARCFDQIRVGLGVNHANVKVVGVGSGLSYSFLGSTHHSIEDLSLMISLPGMSVLAPSDPQEVVETVHLAAEHKGPVYIRLGLNAESLNVSYTDPLTLGKSRLVRAGNDVTLMAIGDMVHVALQVAFSLEKEGISVRVINMSSVKPLDSEAVRQALIETSAIFTLEEHSIVNGLGSAVASVLAEHRSDKAVTFKRFGIRDSYVEALGHKEDLFKECGIDPLSIFNSIKEELKLVRVAPQIKEYPSAYDATTSSTDLQRY